ncbi:endo-1,4-beta-xylanase [Hyunsoonleella jejuensis]|uniref:Beta-xylanase n=1 Tax=Hyunsoonleella jejuensis TaxID=419940 RepID=A0A1H9CVA3_9FLAO|nr:endo-1,4-beta-xylanase [Hyunsoonleella jejuensis]SEQ05071.1 endo-1,4-beta-xylanase [Hyunsoonleella jejuensis]
MKNIITTYKVIFLFAILSAFFACSKDDDTAPPDNPTPIVLSFDVLISEQNPLRVAVNNTSTGTSGLSSYWQFFTNGPRVEDLAGPEVHLYETAGDYTITLTVEGPNGDVSTSQVVSITGQAAADPALKDAADKFSIGMAVKSNRLDGSHGEILTREFNNLTAEFEMKMNIMYPSQGNYDFTAADAIVDYGIANNMDIHGHTLIWHTATPQWVENFSGTDEEFETMIKDYITTVLTRYAGKVRSWDVVNEAVEDGTNQLRNTVFRRRMGDNYIEKCYQFARDADPNVLLFYNDYNITFDAGKQAAMFAIVDDLSSKSIIDGVGAQMHIAYNFPSAAQIQSVVNGAVSRGLKMHFSELDIRANPNNDITSLTDARATAQENKFREVVEIYNAIPEANKFALTVWGIRDNETWLIDFWGQPDWPLLYDSNFNAKKAYRGFLDGLN